MIFARRRFRDSVRRRVTLHLVEGYSLDGVLAGIYADGVELASATFIRADDYDTPLAGTQIVPWSSLVWVQELGDAARLELGAANS